uniref:Uncharacterized protein n=1 Tax=Sphaerodactylus townsendi TaxID=933632 RepID=A0ACB8E6W9_9SAUR
MCLPNPLLWTIEQDTEIQGIQWTSKEHLQIIKATTHTDYVYLWTQPQEFRRIQHHLEQYESEAGACINREKSQVYWIRSHHPNQRLTLKEAQEYWQPAEDSKPLPPSPQPDQSNMTIKILGIQFGTERNDWKVNWTKWTHRSQEKLAEWRKWGQPIHIHQKVLYVHTYLIGPAHHILADYPPPPPEEELQEKVHQIEAWIKVYNTDLLDQDIEFQPIDEKWHIQKHWENSVNKCKEQQAQRKKKALTSQGKDSASAILEDQEVTECGGMEE